MNSLPLAFIIGGRGHVVSTATYVRDWRAIKALPRGTEVRAFNWFTESRESALSELSRGVNDRVNIRGGIVPPVNTITRERRNAGRIRAKLAATVACSCRWCGSALPGYVSYEERFCDGSGRGSCRASYYS